MQLQQLAYFVAVADQRHFTKAAAQAGVAQPSLSQQIKALERDLGAPLFQRARGNLTLTDAGEALLPIARRILADTENARRAVLEVAVLGRGRVRLGATPSLCTGLLPSMLGAFRAEHPGIELILHESGSRDLQRELTEGALDLALVIDARLGDDDPLQIVPLVTEDLVVVSPLDGPPPVEAPEMTVADLEGRPLVMFRDGYDLRETVVDACRGAGFEATFAIEGGELDAVLQFVRAGLGIAVVPSTVGYDRFRVTPFSAPGLARTVLLARRRDLEPPRAARALGRHMLDFLARAAATNTLPPGTRLPA
ncbi:LysR family transcriptional regulator [Cryptosporangium phraense]|uniref:LysR family transcriptional regulator n=1 Tax=Cryptosporangium phraense TaxID=2593070 RepID=A0A545AXW2_9ACTN|nr:LysR substrate-binding domain-containing protein [Cryptosporangium phraense]TQS45435.1 LysR family transcriptional regulator [Cryptosporangium phraense]